MRKPPKTRRSLTVKDVEREIASWEMSPERARNQLTELRDIFDALLVAKTDAERIRLYKKLDHRFNHGFSELRNVVFLSRLAAKLHGKATRSQQRARGRFLREAGYKPDPKALAKIKAEWDAVAAPPLKPRSPPKKSKV